MRGRSSEMAQRILQLIETLLKLVMRFNIMCEVVKVKERSPARVEISRQKTGKGKIRLKLQEPKIMLPQRTIILGSGKSQLLEHKNHTGLRRSHLKGREHQVDQKLTQLTKLIRVA